MTSPDIFPADDSWYRTLVEKAVSGILVEQDGKIVYANEHAGRMLGRKREQLLGQYATNYLAEEDRDRNRQATKRLRGGDNSPGNNEYKITLPSGRVICIAISGSVVELNGRPATLVVLHDMTARADAEAAHRASEERYRQMVSALHEGVMIFDSDGNVQGTNPAAERMLGRTFEEMQTTPAAAWQPLAADGQPLPLDQLPLVHALTTGQPQRNMIVGDVSPAGKLAWLNINAEPLRGNNTDKVIGAVVSFTDVTERRAVEEALIRSEEANRTLMNSLSDGVFVAQDHRFVFANPSLPKMLGYTLDEFIGLPFESIVARDDMEVWTDRFKRRIAPGDEPPRSYEVRFIRKDRKLIELELVANRTRYLDAPAVLGVVRNITERKAVEAEIERHRDHLEELVQERTGELQRAVAARLETETFAQTITDNQPTLIAYLDRERRIQFANRAYLGWFGVTREQVMGRRVSEVLGHSYSNAPPGAVERVLDGEAIGMLGEMPGSDGRWGHFWVYRLPDVRHGQVRGYYFIATDITEIKQAEQRLLTANEALMKAEAFIRTIADNIPGRVAYWDTELRCQFANQMYCDWSGKPRERLIGFTVEEIYGEDRRKTRESRMRSALAGLPQRFEREEESSAGYTATWLVHYVPDQHGDEVRGFFVMASDITQSKRSQARLQALNTELVASRDKAEAGTRAKSSFLANMSHEIRTPMNAIIGITHLLQRDTREPQNRERLAKVGEAAEHLLKIINDVLDLSKIEAGKLDLEELDFDLDALLSRCCQLVAGEAQRKGLELKVERTDLPRSLRGDPTRLLQTAVNLLSNAVKFTDQGSVLLRCRLDKKIDGDMTVRFEVQDTGVGIPPEQLEHIFTAFEQADTSTTRRFGGTGLGLAISRYMAELMGGTIGVDSKLGNGSTFWFTARVTPAINAVESIAGVASDNVSEERLREKYLGARVLLADDNRINQEVARELLLAAGLQVDIADNGRNAVAMAQSSDYELILMDVQMPEMDGLRATRVIRAIPALAALPIIGMTANAFTEDREACLSAGMNDFVRKPVEPAALYDTLLHWLLGDGVKLGPRTFIRQPPASRAASPIRATAVERPAELPDIKGLDVERGLRFCGGNLSSYQQMLDLFSDLYGNGLPAIADYVAGHNNVSLDAVQREVHTFGGAAVSIGAIDIGGKASTIDSQLRMGDTPVDVRSALAELQNDLARMVNELRRERSSAQLKS